MVDRDLYTKVANDYCGLMMYVTRFKRVPIRLFTYYLGDGGLSNYYI